MNLAHGRSGVHWFQRPAPIAALALALMLAWFLREPLSSYSSVYYSGADLTQEFSLTKVGAPHVASNRMLADPVVQMLPWQAFNRDELASGRLPVWNPLNGCGVPHLANYQSAPFSPFGLPFYVLSVRAALLAAAALKLFALGFFTFLFLRELSLSTLAALCGATAFAFCGHNVLLLAFPHSGVAAAIPASLYFAERALGGVAGAHARDERWTRGLRPGAFAGLVCSLAAGVLAGHPEALLFSVALVALYIAFRLIVLMSAAPRGRRGEVTFLGLLLALAGALAAGIGAIQLAPFFEYLDRSVIVATRGTGQQFLKAWTWPLWLFPDLLGNPTFAAPAAQGPPRPSYEQANTIYIGALALYLAVVGVIVARTSRVAVFFAAVVLTWFLAVHGALAADTWMTWIPGARLSPINRSQPIGLFAVCVLCAFAVDRVSQLTGRRRAALAASLALGAAGVLAAAWVASQRLIDSLAAQRAVDPASLESFVDQHRRWIGATLALGALALAALSFARARWQRAVFGAALLAAFFAQGGHLLSGYNPTARNEHFYPRTPAIETLGAAVGDARLLILSEDTLPPDSNAMYGIALTTQYDFMWVRPFDEHFQRLFETSDNWRTTLATGEATLALLGIEYVLTRGEWIAVGTAFGGIERHRQMPVVAVVLAPEAEVVQTFACARDGLESVAVQLGVDAARPAGEVRVRVAELESGTLVHEQVVRSVDQLARVLPPPPVPFRSLLRTSLPAATLVLSFAPQAGSAGKRYSLSLTALDASASLVTWRRGKPEQEGETLSIGALEERGALAFDFSFDRSRFERVAEIGAFRLWRYLPSQGRYWIAHDVATAGADTMEGLTFAPDFDPLRSVVVEAEAGAEASFVPAGDDRRDPRPRIVEETPARVRMVANASRPGCLVAAIARYPGWKARVDGVEAPLLLANCTFNAVPIPAGEHEIELSYEPASIRWGARISAASAAAVIALILALRALLRLAA